MSKAERNRKQSARERNAAQQTAASRAEARRRILVAGGAVLGVVAVVVALVIYSVVSKPSAAQPPGSTTKGALPASVLGDISGVPASTLAAVGAGSALSLSPHPIVKISGPPLTRDGKPEMLYIGAEFCPYCAAVRWSMAVALSRFGTLSPLQGIHSSPTDTDPNTPTVTFYRTSYASKYLAFTPVEHQDVSRSPLQPLTPAQSAIWARYTPGGASQEGYPFVDFGNQLAIPGQVVSPALLAGKTWAQVAAALHDPASPIAQAVDGMANYMTAAICKITGNQPASVCGAAPVITLEAGL